MKLFKFTTEKEEKSSDVDNNKSKIDSLKNAFKKISQDIEESLDDIVDKGEDFLTDSKDFISEKTINISESTKNNFISAKTKLGETYSQFEIKNNLVFILDKIDIPQAVEGLKKIDPKDKKIKNSLTVVITLLNLFQSHKLKANDSISDDLTQETEQLEKTISQLLKDIDMKIVYQEVSPYIGLLPYGNIINLILSLFIK